MREIKFRGLSVNKEWCIGNLSILKKDAPGKPIKKGFYISNKVGSPFAYQVTEETIGQFTGLLDKNGKEIYEDDILRCIYPREEEPQIIISQVSWDEKEALFRVISDYEPEYLYECVEDAEIIGNVHEHPQLIYTVLD